MSAKPETPRFAAGVVREDPTALGFKTPRRAHHARFEPLVRDLEQAWGEGSRPTAEEVLARHPRFSDNTAALIHLVRAEFALRQQHGELLELPEVLDRHPACRDELERLLLETTERVRGAGSLQAPLVGSTLFGEFVLAAQLGHGSEGHVYLGVQTTLADRPVVLKVTPRAGEEHLALARLQHTGIVPLYGVYEDAGTNLRALCMPFFGSATLQQAMGILSGTHPAERTGADVVAAIDRLAVAASVGRSSEGAGREFLKRASYPRAVAWLGARLAEALEYAHERDVVHLDIKPSNVLLADDGQPMLLDFHIAQPPLRAGDVPAQGFGGTPAYMSPEQWRACEDLHRHRPVSIAVDRRSDVYSLGLVLYEVLGGSAPIPPDGVVRPLCEVNPAVSQGLSDVIARCLRPDPTERYQHAGCLAEDLRRYLDDLPFVEAPNRSLRERWQKWRRRNPYQLLAGSLIAGLAAVLVLAGYLSAAHVNEQRRLAEEARLTGDAHVGSRRYEDAARQFERALVLSEQLGRESPLSQALRQRLRSARRATKANELHEMMIELRTASVSDDAPQRMLHALDARCREAWLQRDLLRPTADGILDAAAERRIQTDLLDLALCWSDLRVDLAPPGGEAAASREAVAVLDEAEAGYGASRALERRRAALAAAAGDRGPAEGAVRPASLEDPSAWDHYALGRARLRAGELPEALESLQRAAELNPGDFGTNFALAVCLRRMGRGADAVAALGVCVGQAPGRPECFLERSRAHAAAGNHAKALADCAYVLEQKPMMGDALLQRGVVLYDLGKRQEARQDIDEARRQGAECATAHWYLARLHLDGGDRPAARESLRRALQLRPGHREARELLQSLQTE